MTDIHSLKKIKCFEAFTYQLLLNVNHLDFHKVRAIKLDKYKIVNSAVIKIFAYRLTYGSPEMLKSGIAQTAQEIGSEKVVNDLKELESDDEACQNPDDDASGLLERILLLLHEEVDRYLDQDKALDIYLEENEALNLHAGEDEKEETETSMSRWATSSSGDSLTFKGELLDDLSRHLAEYEKKKAVLSAGKLKAQDFEEDDLKDGKQGSASSREEAAALKEFESEVDKSLNDLVRNLGDDGLDELIFGKKSSTNEDDEDVWADVDWID